MSSFALVFISVFIAELGDKTQLSTLLFASDKDRHPFVVFLAASLALVCSTALAVGAGALAERWLTLLPLKLIAGLGFIIIGAWMVYENFSSS